MHTTGISSDLKDSGPVKVCAGVGGGGVAFSLFHKRRDSLTLSGITRQDAPDLRTVTGHDGETMNGNRKRAARDLKTRDVQHQRTNCRTLRQTYTQKRHYRTLKKIHLTK